MRLYHGTAESIAKTVRTTGLLPRNQHQGTANWQHVFTGSPEAVYLTDAYPMIYAVEATENVMAATGIKERLAIIEIDSDRLDPENFVADEDMLEQVGRGHDGLVKTWSIARRTAYYRSHLREHAALWPKSLELLGTCGYMAGIPAAAIRRIALIDYEQAPYAVLFALDAFITLTNYQFVGIEHRAITNWFFNNPLPSNDSLWTARSLQIIMQLPRDGIEIIEIA